MAKFNIVSVPKVVVVTFWVILSARCQEDGGSPRNKAFPRKERLDNWADKLDKEIYRITIGEDDLTGASKLTEAFQQAFDDGVGFSIKKPDGKAIVEKMMKKISDVFEYNTEALQELHKSAEEAANSYQYNSNLVLKRVNYTNVNAMGHLMNMTEYSHHFKQNVYSETSGVQIPIEIYEGYPNILNSITWTQALDETFKANAAKYPGIYWQSFGAQEGILRVYPASPWKTVDDMPDLFDVRRRPWYIHGTSSPKDMIILLDTSGSMHGQSFDIMKIAAKTLLNTLGENDFVNVAAFSRNVTWVTPCLQGLVQANARNKRLLFDGIDMLVDRNIASYSKALKFAYSELENFEREKDPQDGSECHKLIMVFSDGGTEHPTKIINVYTNSSRLMTANARIFTYAVGPHPLPTVALKDMACSTGGSFTTITAMGAIRTKIQEYVSILNRPLVLEKDYDFHRTTFFSRDHLGLGFVTTITKPVFNTSDVADNQTLAGVVGIDIPVSRFEALAPRSQLGPLGYTFGLNTNGFLIFHPKLWAISNYLEDPAHNDIEDVEGESVAEIRKEMIDMAADTMDQIDVHIGERKMKSSVILHQGHAISVDMDYFYTAIRKTYFSLAVVIPRFWHYIQVPEQLGAQQMLEQMKIHEKLHLAPRKFCDESIQDEDAELDDLDKMLEKLQKESCHGRDFNHLLWDYKIVSENTSPKIDPAQFIVTDGGVYIGHDAPRHEHLKRDPYNSSLYKMAVLTPTPIVYVQKYVDHRVIPIYIHSSDDEEEVVSEEKSENDDGLEVSDEEDTSTTTTPKPTEPPKFVIQVRPPTLYLAQAFRISDGSVDTTLGVSGIELSHDKLTNIMYNASDAPEGSNELDCRHWKDDLLCYLVDTSGYVIATNQEDHVVQLGDFLGVADPQLMGYFLQKGYFKSRVEYNYQALCPTEIVCTTDGVAELPKLFLVTIFNSFLSILQTLNQSFYAIIMAITMSQEIPIVESVSEYTKQVTEGLHRCTTKIEHWEWSTEAPLKFHDRIDANCQGISNCNRMFHSYKLNNLNALMIIADPQWCGNCKTKPIFDGPMEVPSGDDCQLPNRYRRRPEDCFATHEAEVNTCSSTASDLKSAILLSVLVPLFSLPWLIIPRPHYR